MSKDLGHDEERYRRYRALLAPGTPLREGLERIRAGHTGALIVLGTNPVVEQVSTGGFTVEAIDTRFIPATAISAGGAAGSIDMPPSLGADAEPGAGVRCRGHQASTR